MQHGSFYFIFMGLKSREKWNGWLVMYSRNDPCGVQSIGGEKQSTVQARAATEYS